MTDLDQLTAILLEHTPRERSGIECTCDDRQPPHQYTAEEYARHVAEAITASPAADTFDTFADAYAAGYRIGTDDPTSSPPSNPFRDRADRER